MERAELITHLEHLAEYVKYSEDAPALREAIEILRCSEMPNSSEERTETHACVLIKRQNAIDAVNSIENLDAKARGGICFKLMGLPSAEPESIKCKDCGYAEERGCALFCGFWTRYTAHKGYCFKAERREENHG